MSVGANMEGGDRIAEAIRTKLLKTNVAIGTVTIGIVPGGRRGAEKNAMIAHVQAGLKRNPWYIDKDTLTAIRFLVRGMASADPATVSAALKQTGDIMINAVRSHVEQMRNSNGSTFAELTARYAAFKRRKFGFIHPILRASNDLLGGLKAVITRG